MRKRGKCSLSGCEEPHHGRGYCNTHYRQFMRYGEIPERICSHRNEIREEGNVCYMDLYTRENEVRATTKFSKRHLKKIKKHKWRVYAKGYVGTAINKKEVYLHRFIKKGKEIDHIDRDRLNNIDNNLRAVTRYQNVANAKTKGYCYDNTYSKWLVQGVIKGKRVFKKHCKTEKEAKKLALEFRKRKYFEAYGELNTFIS